MHINRQDEFMTRKEVAQLVTIFLHSVIENEKITEAINLVDKGIKDAKDIIEKSVYD